jgi:hypothetical protein
MGDVGWTNFNMASLSQCKQGSVGQVEGSLTAGSASFANSVALMYFHDNFPSRTYGPLFVASFTGNYRCVAFFMIDFDGTMYIRDPGTCVYSGGINLGTTVEYVFGANYLK